MEEVTDSSNSSGDTAQFSQQVPLDQPSNENKNESAPAQVAGSSDASGQVAGTVVLPADANAVSIVSDGLVFEIDDTTKTATLVGSAATPPKGDLLVPASVTSGTTTYEVTAIAKNVFAKCSELTSVSLPATLREVDPDAVAGCPSLKSITVNSKNEAFSASDGMLFSKDYSKLLLIPEGMEGAANIPGSTTTVPAQALSRCLLMGSSLTAGDGSAAFTTLNGMLFSKDLKTLVSCPPAIGNAVVLPAETETIGEYALAGCKDLTAITTLGNVREINPTAFTDEVKASAVVALPAGESKAVWEQAGFQHFAEPAAPGATTRSEVDAEDASGLVFTLLDDYTLSVTWEGAEDPAADLEIPASAEINGVSYRVSTIATNAFANRGSLTSLKLPASITSIGEAAFAGCANLADIQLPGNLNELGERAFEATSLTDIWLPASVQYIGSRAFASCESLTRIVALGTPQVADDALVSCANLSIYSPYNPEGTYPWNLGLIANNNHLMPYGLTLSEEPLHLETGQSANLFEGTFNEAPEPCEVSYSYAAKPISVDPDGTVTGKAPGTSEVTATLTLNNHELARAIRTVEITVASEDAGADLPANSLTHEEFKDKDRLATPIPPISSFAQLNSSINLMADVSVPTVGSSFEQQASSGTWYRYTITNISGNAGQVDVSKSTDASKAPTGDIVVPEVVTYEQGGSSYTFTVTGVADSGFANCSFTSVALPNTVKKLYGAAFDKCEKLTTLPAMLGVEELRWNAFRGCSQLKDAILPSTVKSVDGLVFEACTSLETIWIPKSVTSFGSGPFAGCENVSSVTVEEGSMFRIVNGALLTGDGKKLIDSAAARTCAVDGCYAIPEGVEIVGNASFKSKNWVSALVFPTTLKTIDEATFDLMGGLKEILDLSGAVAFDPSNKSFLRSGDPVVYCPEGAVASWQAMSAAAQDSPAITDAVAFSAGLPATFAVPSNFTEAALEPSLSIPQDSAFAKDITFTWSYSDGFDSLAKCTPSADGKRLSMVPIAGATGEFTASAQMTFRGGAPLASGSTTVHVAEPHGALPTVFDALNTNETKAGWSLSPEGVLKVWSAEDVADFGWADIDVVTDHWKPFCEYVKSVDVSITGTPSMAKWFQDMHNLTDVSRLLIPDTVKNIKQMMEQCTSLTTVPDTFVIPAGVVNAQSLFNSCSSLVALPAGFAFGNAVCNLSYMFSGCSSLKNLPAGFSIAFNAKASQDVEGMFFQCTSLESLPESFVLPESVTNTAGMFQDCVRLSSLPEQFRVPSSISAEGTACRNMFASCDSLLIYPKNFGLSRYAAAQSHVFYTATPTPLYYAGSDEGMLSITESQWQENNRTLITPHEGSVVFNLSSKDGSAWEEWGVVDPGDNGLVSEPAVPERAGEVFTLWYADQECTKRYDFSKSPADNGLSVGTDGKFAIYGTYAEGSFGGSLSCEPGTGSAWWSLADDGTLYIRGGGTVNFSIPDDDAYGSAYAWSPYRSKVFRVCMTPSLKAKGMVNWFYSMQKLSDVSEAFIPEGSVTLHRAFMGCRALEALPEGFSIPDSVESLASAFGSCSALRSLPSTFVFSEKSKITNVSGLFIGCKALSSLPEGFTLPAGVLHVKNAFKDCPSLTTLPEGFSFPSTVSADDMLFFCTIAEGAARVPTYYTGDNTTVLNFDWASQNRTLVTDAGDRNAFTVIYRVGNDDGTWTTRSTALTNDAGLAPDLGTPSRDGYGFTGWCKDEDCMVPFDFSRPLDSDREIYGKWIKYGGRDKAVGEGQLPVVPDSGEAWWQITSDGTLMIMGDGKVKDLGWTWDGFEKNNTHWYPVRNSVRRIVMSDSLRAETMYCWFHRMSNLVNIEKVHIPDDVQSISCLFFACSNLEAISDNFIIPESVTNMNSMFNGCFSLRDIPESFRLPSKVTTAICLFQNASIRTIPEALGKSIASSTNLEVIDRMFNSCSELESLPSTFALPQSVKNAGGLFNGCSSLKSLPEGFKVPDSVGSSTNRMTSMFSRCDSLTYLPASFDFPLDVANDSTNPFMAGGTEKLKTYFAGGADSSSSVNSYNWGGQNREIVTTVPEDSVKVRFYLSDSAGAFGDVPWFEQLAKKDAALDEPIVPGREGAAFLGWYTTRECTTKFNFSDTLTTDTKLYGKYAAAAGLLPTVRDGATGEEASWSFDRGTLTIRCDVEGAEIMTLWNLPENGDINSTPRTGYWSPLRDRVEKVVIENNVRVQNDLRFWFSGMTNLVDVSEFKFPAGATDVTHLFAQCSSLTSLPNNFVIPDHVTNLDGLFLGTGLESLPASFKLPSNATILSATFGSSKLTSLPDGFTLPSKAATTSYMFSQTPLKELPSTFRLPDELANCGAMFESCTNLVSLPAGFTIPAKVTDTRNMFYQCTSLMALPEGFVFADATVLKNVAGMFSGCLSLTTLPASLDLRSVPSTCEGLSSMFSVGAPRSTYVVGGDLAKLAIAGNDAASYWLANYKRTLVTDVASLGGAVTVTFKTKVAGQADWSTYMTVLTDASGKVPDPGARSQFGYAFDGWRTEAGEVFNFGAQTLTQNTVLYGTLTPIVRLEVPSKVRVNVAADGTLTPAVARVRSYTPEPVAFTLDCTEANAASEVLPRAEDRASLAVEVGVGKRTYQVYLGDTGVGGSSFRVPAATGSAMPGELELSLGLTLPSDVRINFLGDGWSTDVAQLTYRAAVLAS
ncbi:leucine-rich repeat protein [Gordonibacter faecis]|uniref:Leucine-rich repeat protein n=1 Tax=Gordonibacter faecis TaxID=3047475 RepID=A0ABT7DPR6_9ACTN|nr:leucine-rich repeat protein [Gordonibacter sp. KGMB12511]MDJ1651540.1 leucine-rich repeat protein [Gordonibacter sp. KGMB12511]